MRVHRPTSLTTFVVLCLSTAACMTWRRSSDPVPSVLNHRPGLVRIVRADNLTIEIRNPTLVGDSIVGTAKGRTAGDSASDRAAVAVADVKEMSVRGVSVGRSVALVAGVGATAILIAAAASNDAQPTPAPCSNGCVASCPLVYSWDGHIWRLDSGTFGGAILPALKRTDVDNLDFATAEGDSLRLRVTNELPETDHIDEIRVLAVDHDVGVSVAPGPDGTLHSVGPLQAPLAARDFAGRDVETRVARRDGWGWESAAIVRDTTTESRDGVLLTFRRPRGSLSARLVLDAHNTPWAAHLMRQFVQAHGRETAAWYDSTTAHPELARGIGAAMAREAFLSVSVWTGREWTRQGLAWEAGPEVPKRQVIPIDLTGVSGDTVLVRLESAPALWRIDAAALDFSTEDRVAVQVLAVSRAADRSGHDIRSLIEKSDGLEYVSALGDSADLTFAVPREKPGRARSYLLQSTGWYRIQTGENGEPDREMFARMASEPNAISHIATERLNAAIVAAGPSR